MFPRARSALLRTVAPQKLIADRVTEKRVPNWQMRIGCAIKQLKCLSDLNTRNENADDWYPHNILAPTTSYANAS